MHFLPLMHLPRKQIMREKDKSLIYSINHAPSKGIPPDLSTERDVDSQFQEEYRNSMFTAEQSVTSTRIKQRIEWIKYSLKDIVLNWINSRRLSQSTARAYDPSTIDHHRFNAVASAFGVS